MSVRRGISDRPHFPCTGANWGRTLLAGEAWGRKHPPGGMFCNGDNFVLVLAVAVPWQLKVYLLYLMDELGLTLEHVTGNRIGRK